MAEYIEQEYINGMTEDLAAYREEAFKQLDDIDFFDTAATTADLAILTSIAENSQQIINDYIDYMSTTYANTYADAFGDVISTTMPFSSTQMEISRELVRENLTKINSKFYENIKLKTYYVTEKLEIIRNSGKVFNQSEMDDINEIIRNAMYRGEGVDTLKVRLGNYLDDNDLRVFWGDGSNFKKDVKYLQLYNPETGKYHNYEFDKLVETWANTGLQRAHIQGNVDSWITQGKDIGIITYSDGRCCPLCKPWEGIKISLTGRNSNLQSLDTVRASGVFHPRCRHDVALYSSDVDEYLRGDQPIFENVKMYPHQRQRFKNLGFKL